MSVQSLTSFLPALRLDVHSSEVGLIQGSRYARHHHHHYQNHRRCRRRHHHHHPQYNRHSHHAITAHSTSLPIRRTMVAESPIDDARLLSFIRGKNRNGHPRRHPNMKSYLILLAVPSHPTQWSQFIGYYSQYIDEWKSFPNHRLVKKRFVCYYNSYEKRNSKNEFEKEEHILQYISHLPYMHWSFAHTLVHLRK